MTRAVIWTKEMIFHRSIIENAGALGWITLSDGYCPYVSKKWCEVTGTDDVDAHGFGWIDSLHPEDRVRVRRVFFDANDAGEEYGVDYRLITVDGPPMLVWGHGVPWRAPNQSFLGYLGTTTPMHKYSSKSDFLRARQETPLETPLTTREKEIVSLVADGKGAEEVAIVLSITPRTVESHMRNVMEKLNANNRAHAVAKAIRLNAL